MSEMYDMDNLDGMQCRINDSFVNVVGRRPNKSELDKIVVSLPQKIVLLAERWGWSDTEVGDFTFRWIEENKGEWS